MNGSIGWMQVSIIVTAIAAIATVIYAILTVVIVRETIALRRAQTEPNIVLLIQPEEKHPNLYDIIVKNNGSGAAYNLKWHYDKTVELATKENVGINRFEFFQSVNYFAPGQEFRSLLGSGLELMNKPFPPALELKLEYENEKGKTDTKKFILNPALLYGHSWIGDQHDIAESLKILQREISHLSSGFHRLKVDVYDKSDRDKEKKKYKKIYDSIPDKNENKRVDKKK